MNIQAPAPRLKRFLKVCSVFAAIATIVASLAFVSASAQERSVRIEKFDLSQNGKVKVENFRGSVRVEVWSDRGIKVVAEKKKPASSPLLPADLKLMGMNSEVTVQCEQNGEPDRIDLTVYVPRNAQLQVTGGAFPVDIDGSLASAVVKTTSGDIGYHLPSSDSARVVMHSTKGVVRSALKLTVDQKIGLRTLEGTIGDGTSPIMMNSGSGNITLMPSSSKVASVVSDDNGELQLSNPPEPKARNDRSGQARIAKQGSDQEENPENSISVPPSERQNQSGGNAAGSQGGYTPDYDPPPPRAVRSGGGSGETVFAGQGQATQSSTTVKSGMMPVPRPITKADTNENSMGMKVRIIPSDSTSGGAGDPRYPNQAAADQIYKSGDQDQDAQGSGSRQNSSSSSSTDGGSNSSGSNQSNSSAGGGGNSPGNAPPGVSGSNSDFVFAGHTSAENAKSTTVSTLGVVPRPRTETDAREDNMGLKVRIIPSGSTAGGAGDPRYPGQKASDDIYSQDGPDSATRSNGRSSSVLYDSASDGGGRAANEQPPAVRPSAARQPLPADDDGTTAGNSPRGSRSTRPSGDAIVLTSSLVSVNVSVTDRTGKILSGLNKADFNIFENNQPQEVEFFAPSTAPFNLVLLLDLSGSISDRLEVVKSAALHFIDVLGPQDKVAIATFTRQVTVLSQLTSDRDLLRKRIKSIRKPEGGTAFYEAMWFSLVELLRGTQGQRNAIVVVSDGVDNSLDRFNPANSRVSFPQLARKLELSDCIVFPIYVDTEYEEVFERGNTTSESYAVARDQLGRMASITGGEMFKAQQPEDLAGVYNQVADAIRTVYSVGYYPTNAQRDGTYRRVSVGVDKTGAVVRTRRGYYAN